MPVVVASCSGTCEFIIIADLGIYHLRGGRDGIKEEEEDAVQRMS